MEKDPIHSEPSGQNNLAVRILVRQHYHSHQMALVTKRERSSRTICVCLLPVYLVIAIIELSI